MHFWSDCFTLSHNKRKFSEEGVSNTRQYFLAPVMDMIAGRKGLVGCQERRASLSVMEVGRGVGVEVGGGGEMEVWGGLVE